MMHYANIITLTTDFGLQDPYVGQVKGAILKNNISVRIIDLCHSVSAHNVYSAAVMIHTSYNYFPQGTVHMVVVDPGVGTQRGILAVNVDNHLFIAPDNGALSLLFQDARFKAVHRVENENLFPAEISSTFHGRDIMAPVAAALAGGMSLDAVGQATSISHCVHLRIPQPLLTEKSIEGEVLHVDVFGNLRTNITAADLSQYQPARFSGIRVKGHQINTIVETYGQSPENSLVAVIDSGGYLEIAVNRGNAAKLTKSRPGTPLLVLMDNRSAMEKAKA